MIKVIEPLGKHDRAALSCDVAALDDWFRLRAGQDEKRNVARVFVAIDDQRGIVGFYSLSSFTLSITDLPPERAKRLPRYDAIPAALIGRLTPTTLAPSGGSWRLTIPIFLVPDSTHQTFVITFSLGYPELWSLGAFNEAQKSHLGSVL